MQKVLLILLFIFSLDAVASMRPTVDMIHLGVVTANVERCYVAIVVNIDNHQDHTFSERGELVSDTRFSVVTMKTIEGFYEFTIHHHKAGLTVNISMDEEMSLCLRENGEFTVRKMPNVH